jgi:hypothetical protein
MGWGMRFRTGGRDQHMEAIQALERAGSLFSRPWNFAWFARVTVCLWLAALCPAAGAAMGGLPGTDEPDWPIATLLRPHGRVAQLAGRLDGEGHAVRAAEQQLQRALRSSDAAEQYSATVVLAAHFRRTGRASEATALVEAYSDLSPGNIAPEKLEAFLEYARLEAVTGNPLSAFRALDYARERAQGLGAPLVRVACADVVELVPDYVKSMDWLREALEAGDRAMRPRSESAGAAPVAPPGADRWPPLRRAIERRISALEFKATAQRWGPEYAYYLAAQRVRRPDHPLARDFTDTTRLYPGNAAGRARIDGVDFERALALYDRLIAEAPDTVYGEAGQLYRAYCLIGQLAAGRAALPARLPRRACRGLGGGPGALARRG